MIRRARQEEGWTLIVAIMVLTVMLMLGLATLAFSGGQTKQTREERTRESAYNLAEAVLNATAAYLGSNWPSATTPFPTACTQAGGTGCPDATSIGSGFTGADYNSSSWSVSVYDNGGASASFYNDAATPSQPRYDAGGDGLWIRAQGISQGRKRVVVAMVKRDTLFERFPRNVITAGKVSTSNNGRKVIIDAKGTAGTGMTSTIAVRCATAPPARGNSCLDYVPDKGQVSPNNAYTTGSVGVACPTGVTKCAMTDADIDRLRQQAKNSNTYYGPGVACPSNLTGALVFVEDTNCSGGGNSASTPGMLVLFKGTLSVGGNSTYYGVVYAANRNQLTGNVVQVTGNGLIQGAIAVDYDGGVLAGSSKTNVVFDPNVFNAVTSSTGAAMAPGTFREIPAS
ncbi:MAG: hypothetical protein ABR581_09805 [Thermoleophilaceae bacterium]